MLEAEMKFAVGDAQTLEAALARLGLRWQESVRQEDHYYNHPCRDFARSDEALRLRCQQGRVTLTYKGPKLDQQTKTRLELSVALAQGEPQATLQQAQALLQALGFRPVAVVGKTRRRGELMYRGQRVQVAWDQVDQLGQFVELEIACQEHQADAARATLLALADELALSQSIRTSYLEMLLQKLHKE